MRTLLLLLALTMFAPVSGFAQAEPSKRTSAQEVLERVARLKEEGSQTVEKPRTEETSSAWVLIRGLGITFGMLGLVIWGLKKIKPGMEIPDGRSVRIIERVAVSPKVSLLVVEFDGRRMLLGLGADTIRPISTDLSASEVGLMAAGDDSRFAA